MEHQVSEYFKGLSYEEAVVVIKGWEGQGSTPAYGESYHNMSMDTTATIYRDKVRVFFGREGCYSATATFPAHYEENFYIYKEVI